MPQPFRTADPYFGTSSLLHCHTSTQVENFGKVCWNMFGCYTMEANICSVENVLYVAPKYVWGSWAWRPWISMWGLGSLCWLSTFGDGCMAMFFFFYRYKFSCLSFLYVLSPDGCRKRVCPWDAEKGYALGVPRKGV